MKHEIARYDLLPLMWWEHPGYVGAFVVASFMVLCLIGLMVRRAYRIRYRPRTVAERLLMRLELLKSLPYEQPRDVRYAYTELMRIVREFASASFGIGHDSLTDEEFVMRLEDTHNAELPAPFTAVAVTVSYEACQVKFAAESIDRARLVMRLDQAVELIKSSCLAVGESKSI